MYTLSSKDIQTSVKLKRHIDGGVNIIEELTSTPDRGRSSHLKSGPVTHITR
jgi:hypothetical protein